MNAISSRWVKLALILALVASTNAGAETYAGSNVDVRTILYYTVSSDALTKFVPDGWELSSVDVGPGKGANLIVELVDQLWAVSPDGKVASPYRYVLFGMPVRQNGSSDGKLMLIDGLSPGGAGPYGIAEKATDDVSRSVRAKLGRTTAEESWRFDAELEHVALVARFDRGELTRDKGDSHVYSQLKPQFSRLYRFDERVDVVRGAGAKDHLQSVKFTARGGKLTGLFDGKEQLRAFVSVPSYTRDIYVPE